MVNSFSVGGDVQPYLMRQERADRNVYRCVRTALWTAVTLYCLGVSYALLDGIRAAGAIESSPTVMRVPRNSGDAIEIADEAARCEGLNSVHGIDRHLYQIHFLRDNEMPNTQIQAGSAYRFRDVNGIPTCTEQ